MNASPVRIRGTLHPSQAAAARAFGLHPHTIQAALDAGRIDDVGLPRKHTGGQQPKPCVYRGVGYPSRKAAALACGVTIQAVSSAVRKI